MLLTLPSVACAQYPIASTAHGPATIHGCHDGDTCTITLPSLPPLFGDRLSIRLAGIDTPELTSHCASERARAVAARNFLRRALLEAKAVEIDLIARDKYFRVLALIRADGVDLADALVEAGLASPYDVAGQFTHEPLKNRGYEFSGAGSDHIERELLVGKKNWFRAFDAEQDAEDEITTLTETGI